MFCNSSFLFCCSGYNQRSKSTGAQSKAGACKTTFRLGWTNSHFDLFSSRWTKSEPLPSTFWLLLSISLWYSLVSVAFTEKLIISTDLFFTSILELLLTLCRFFKLPVRGRRRLWSRLLGARQHTFGCLLRDIGSSHQSGDNIRWKDLTNRVYGLGLIAWVSMVSFFILLLSYLCPSTDWCLRYPRHLDRNRIYSPDASASELTGLIKKLDVSYVVFDPRVR